MNTKLMTAIMLAGVGACMIAFAISQHLIR